MTIIAVIIITLSPPELFEIPIWLRSTRLTVDEPTETRKFLRSAAFVPSQSAPAVV